MFTYDGVLTRICRRSGSPTSKRASGMAHAIDLELARLREHGQLAIRNFDRHELHDRRGGCAGGKYHHHSKPPSATPHPRVNLAPSHGFARVSARSSFRPFIALSSSFKCNPTTVEQACAPCRRPPRTATCRTGPRDFRHRPMRCHDALPTAPRSEPHKPVACRVNCAPTRTRRLFRSRRPSSPNGVSSPFIDRRP